MRLLAFSDPHRNRDRAEHLVRLAGEADVVVGAGHYATARGDADRGAQFFGLGEAVIGTTPVVNVGPDGRFFEI